MYMERIAVTKGKVAKPRPLALKLGAGFVFLCMSVIVAPIWFIACAAWFGLAAIARGLGALVLQAWRTTIWAGELVVGR
jgi:hypothetical protein